MNIFRRKKIYCLYITYTYNTNDNNNTIGHGSLRFEIITKKLKLNYKFMDEATKTIKNNNKKIDTVIITNWKILDKE